MNEAPVCVYTHGYATVMIYLYEQPKSETFSWNSQKIWKKNSKYFPICLQFIAKTLTKLPGTKRGTLLLS